MQTLFAHISVRCKLLGKAVAILALPLFLCACAEHPLSVGQVTFQQAVVREYPLTLESNKKLTKTTVDSTNITTEISSKQTDTISDNKKITDESVKNNDDTQKNDIDNIINDIVLYTNQYRCLNLYITVADEKTEIKQMILTGDNGLSWTFVPLSFKSNGSVLFGRDFLTAGTESDLAGTYSLEVLGGDGTTDKKTFEIPTETADSENTVSIADGKLVFVQKVLKDARYSYQIDLWTNGQAHDTQTVLPFRDMKPSAAGTSQYAAIDIPAGTYDMLSVTTVDPASSLLYCYRFT
jgi:hypothetical protein